MIEVESSGVVNLKRQRDEDDEENEYDQEEEEEDEEDVEDEDEEDEELSESLESDLEEKSRNEIIEKRKLKTKPRKPINVSELTCSYCLKVFSRASKLEYHIRIHTGEKPYHCKFEGCDKKFTRSHHLSYHEKTHQSPTEKDEKLKCEFPGCTSTFVFKHHLQTHIKSKHSDEKPYKCTHDTTKCKLSFSKHNQLKRHIATIHLNLEPYECTYQGCGQRFQYPSWLKKHVARKHEGTPLNVCMFPGCKEKFVTLLELQKHRKQSHTIKYPCDKCKSVFKSSSKLSEHKKSHLELEDRKSFNCTFDGCMKTYLTKSGLDSHIKSIHLEQSFTCQLPKLTIVTQPEPTSIKIGTRKKIKLSNGAPSTTTTKTTTTKSSKKQKVIEEIEEKKEKQQQEEEEEEVEVPELKEEDMCNQKFTTKKSLFRHIELVHNKNDNNTKVLPSENSKLVKKVTIQRENKINRNITSLIGKKPSFEPDDSIYD